MKNINLPLHSEVVSFDPEAKVHILQPASTNDYNNLLFNDTGVETDGWFSLRGDPFFQFNKKLYFKSKNPKSSMTLLIMEV